MFMCKKKNPVLYLQSLKKTTNGRKTLCFPTMYVKWREFNKNKNKQLRSNPWSMTVKRQEAEAHLLVIAHGLPPRPGWPLPGLQDPLDQQHVLGECSVNVSNSCREIRRATAHTMSSLFKSMPRMLPKNRVLQMCWGRWLGHSLSQNWMLTLGPRCPAR